MSKTLCRTKAGPIGRTAPADTGGSPRTGGISGRVVVLLALAFSALTLIGVAGMAAAQGWEQVNEGFVNGHLAQAFDGGMNISKPTFADTDGDADLDMFVGQSAGNIRFYRNTGTRNAPSFSLVDNQFLGIIGSNTGYYYQVGAHNSPVIADIDGNGTQDLIFGTQDLINLQATGTLHVWLNTGTSTQPQFTDVSTSFTSITVPGFAQPAFCDIDSDGDLDLFMGYGYGTGGQGGGVRFFRNTGSATHPAFTEDPSVTIPVSGEADLHPAFVDVDGDGDFGLFVGSYGGPLLFCRNIGTSQTPQFVQETSPLPAIALDNWTSPAFADLDTDGDMDCFVGGSCGFVLFMKNNGTPETPSFSAADTSLPGISFDLKVGGWGAALGQHSTPALADIDADGDLDLFMGQYNPGQISFWENEGSPCLPNFVLVTHRYAGISFGTLHPPAYLSHPCFGDIDNDGDLDLFIGREDGRIIYYRNDGTSKVAAFILVSEEYVQTPSTDAWAAPTLVDIDGDGDLDMVVGERWGSLLLFRNNGTPSSPSFGAAENMGLSPGLMPKPTFFDVDGDGDMDLFVGVDHGGGHGGVVFYRNTGTRMTPVFTLESTDYILIPDGYPTFPAPTFGDVDGDGDTDLILGMSQGAVLLYKNQTAHLSLQPASASLLPGQSVQFAASGGSGAISWSLVADRSGAKITSSGLTTASYDAGTTTGVTDVIECRDSTGKIGRAYVNVVSAAQLSASGKAVVMAGRKAGDALWDSTNYLANSIYRMLLYRGFSKENVQYLNPQTGQDVDGNGADDDIDAASSRAALGAALTSFASGSPNLFVYLIDHGEADPVTGGNGLIRCNESEVEYAAEVDAYLDDLQANHGVTTVTLVVDACQSGSFLAACSGAPAGAARVVVCSASSLQPAFFSALGLISFTDAFVNGLYSGLSVGEAFQLGAGAMDRYQQPCMDDDGDGVYDKDLDGAMAEGLTVGATFIAGADRPQIGKISANQSLTGGAASATVWASDVASVYPIDRVWATIAAPDFVPAALTEPGNPVLNLPELEMTWNAGASRYEATTNTFESMGAYRVNIYAQDTWGGVSYPKQTYVNQTYSDERIAIVCGDGPYDANSPWEYSDYLARNAYETARARWIADDKITYLTSAASTPERPVDGPPTQANLESAISAAAGIGKFTVYLVGRGDASGFDLDGDGAASDPDDLTPAELDAALDACQTAHPTSPTLVNVILDFTQSGAWLAPLTAPAGKERVVIASCGAGEASWCEEGGAISFSQWFFSKVFNGVNVRNGFNWARAAVRGVTDATQNPVLDDDGSGTPTQQDGALALTTYIGAAFVTGADSPIIGDYAKDIELTSNAETLWASAVWDADGIAEVYAYVVRPGATATIDQIDKVDLAYSAANGRWEAVCSNFDPDCDHTVIYVAKDRNSDLSEPYKTVFSAQTLGVAGANWMLY